jgi:hypothetical protein
VSGVLDPEAEVDMEGIMVCDSTTRDGIAVMGSSFPLPLPLPPDFFLG